MKIRINPVGSDPVDIEPAQIKKVVGCGTCGHKKTTLHVDENGKLRKFKINMKPNDMKKFLKQYGWTG